MRVLIMYLGITITQFKYVIMQIESGYMQIIISICIVLVLPLIVHYICDILLLISKFI